MTLFKVSRKDLFVTEQETDIEVNKDSAQKLNSILDQIYNEGQIEIISPPIVQKETNQFIGFKLFQKSKENTNIVLKAPTTTVEKEIKYEWTEQEEKELKEKCSSIAVDYEWLLNCTQSWVPITGKLEIISDKKEQKKIGKTRRGFKKSTRHIPVEHLKEKNLFNTTKQRFQRHYLYPFTYHKPKKITSAKFDNKKSFNSRPRPQFDNRYRDFKHRNNYQPYKRSYDHYKK